jgi:hypothetical protein
MNGITNINTNLENKLKRSSSNTPLNVNLKNKEKEKKQAKNRFQSTNELNDCSTIASSTLSIPRVTKNISDITEKLREMKKDILFKKPKNDQIISNNNDLKNTKKGSYSNTEFLKLLKKSSIGENLRNKLSDIYSQLPIKALDNYSNSKNNILEFNEKVNEKSSMFLNNI